MWYKVEIRSSITVAIKADSKEAAQDKAKDAVWFSDVEGAIIENMEVETVTPLDDEDDADMCNVKSED